MAAEKCSIQGVLNAIMPYHEWYEIGEYLGLPHGKLDEIRGSYYVADQKANLVELWYREDPCNFGWTKLWLALKRLVEVQSRRKGSTVSADNWACSPTLLIQPSLPEELSPNNEPACKQYSYSIVRVNLHYCLLSYLLQH